MKLGLAKTGELPLYTEYTDYNGTGLVLRQIKAGMGAGRIVCIQPASMSFANMLTRTDLAAIRGCKVETYDLGITPLKWISDGTLFRPDGEQMVLRNGVLTSGIASAVEQAIVSLSIPAGLLYLQRFKVEAGLAKSGATDTASAALLRLGVNGTTADAAIGGTSGAVMAAANRTVGTTNVFESTDATHIVKRGNGGDNGSYIGVASNVAANVNYAVTNLQTTAQKLTQTLTLTGATDTPQVESIALWLLP